MPDSSLPAVRSVSSSCLPLLPVLSFAALILGVAQSAQANDVAISFELAQAPTLPAESAYPAVQVASADPQASPQASSRPKKKRVKAPPCDGVVLCLGQEGEETQPGSEPGGTVRAERQGQAHPNSVASQTTPAVTFSRGELFVGGSRSLVAKAVGAAEGTRTPDGHKTPAYYGHTDPGNRAWNLGSFSYQHGASSPEEADRKQLARLEAQAQLLRQQAQARGIELTLEEELNGIDLANQAPLAALDRGGYIDRLIQARKLGMTGSESVTWARTQSFIEPRTGRLNAPGLGNRLDWVLQDQERRRAAVERAIALHKPAAVSPGVESLIQADTGSSLVQSPPISRVMSEVKPDRGKSHGTNVAQGSPAIAVQSPAREPLEGVLSSPIPRTILRWTEQVELPEVAADAVVSRLSAQAARVRSSLRSLDRMRSMLPGPATSPSSVQPPISATTAAVPTTAPRPPVLEPSPTPTQTPLLQSEQTPAQSPHLETTVPTPAPQSVPAPSTPAPEPVQVGSEPPARLAPDSSPAAEPAAPPIPQTAEPAAQPAPLEPAPPPQTPEPTPPREEVAEALIHLDLPDFSLAPSP